MNNKKKLVFLVDDNLLNLHAGKKILGEKYIVVAMPSAKNLFLALAKIKPALILLDVDMPEMNGFEAIEILKAKPETKDIPVIFITGRDGENDKATGLALGAVEYIVKPYEPSLLLKTIETTLGA